MVSRHSEYDPHAEFVARPARDRLSELGIAPRPKLSVVSSQWLLEGELRLDASFYSDTRIAAERLVREAGLPVKAVGDLAEEIFAAPISSRHFALQGAPYLTPSDVYCFRPVAEKFVVEHKLRSPERWRVKAGWPLVSQSGAVGRVCLATRRLEGFVVSQNLLRVVPRSGTRSGYLCAFLQSWIGQALLTKERYGSAIKHLEPHHVAGVPIPVLDDAAQEDLDRAVTEAYALRDDANDLLDQADDLLHTALGIEPFDPAGIEYLPQPKAAADPGPKMPPLRAFTVGVGDLQNRFDGSYHAPVAATAVGSLRRGRYELVPLGHVADRVYIPPRFARVYVEEPYGVPFLQGSHLPALEPYDLKYISRSQTKGLERWIIEKGWVLVTCSGTIGQVGLVSSFTDGWAASQHILRVIATRETLHPGFLAAFLATPYGKLQVLSKVYGGVVDELTEDDTRALLVPNAPFAIQVQVGGMVVEAYEKKDQAIAMEKAAVKRLEALLSERSASGGVVRETAVRRVAEPTSER